jgi:outer membrane protein assembly factor BamB
MKRKTLACLILVATATSLVSAQQGPSSSSALRGSASSNVDWAQFNFDAAHDGYNSYETILNSSNVADVTLKWSYRPSIGTPEAPPAVGNGMIYFGSEFGSEPVVYALNADTGEFAWFYQTDSQVNDSPAVGNGVVYVVGGYVYALDANTGALVWRSQYFSYGGSPTVVNGIVYANSGYAVDALDAKTGTRLWEYQLSRAPNSSPTVANGVVYSNSADGDVYALNATNGALIWHRQLGTTLVPPYQLQGLGSGQSVANGVLYLALRNRLYALDANTGATIWSVNGVSLGHTTPAVANGVVFIADGNFVDALNASTGALLWKYLTNCDWVKSPIVANGVLYIGSWKVYGESQGAYKVDAVDASTATLLWESTFNGNDNQYLIIPSPIAVNGMIYGVPSPTAIGAWALPN